MFSINAMASMIQENKILQDTVSLLGGFYASRNPNLLTFSKNEERGLVSQWRQLQKSVALGIKEVASDGKPDVLLACALLLSFVQVMNIWQPRYRIYDPWLTDPRFWMIFQGDHGVRGFAIYMPLSGEIGNLPHH